MSTKELTTVDPSSLPPEIFEEILGHLLTPQATSSGTGLFHFREVCRAWKDLGDKKLESLFNGLREVSNSGSRVLKNLFASAGETSNPLFTLNQKIREIFQRRGINLSTRGYRFITDPSQLSKIQELEKQLERDDALKSVWPKIRTALVDNGAQNLPSSDASAATIRAFLDNPANQGELDQITSLDLSKSSLKRIPLELRQFSQLTHLSLNGNQITEIPANLSLPRLTDLFLDRNQIKEIPATLSLPRLTKLYLDGNRIKEIPANLALSLPQLTRLVLNGNQIKEIPATLSLPQLTQLLLNGNQIREIPATLSLPQLTLLSLGGNQIKEIPATLSLPRLTDLSLNGNRIKEIPANLTLPQLTHLFLNGNQIREIPANLALSLPQLTDLFLDGNQIKEIPATLSLPRLTKLYLDGNRIKEIPANLTLPRLTDLFLHDNPLMFISDKISQIQNLSRYCQMGIDQLLAQLNSQKTHPCQSSLAKLYQAILGTKDYAFENDTQPVSENIQGLFSRLSEEEKMGIETQMKAASQGELFANRRIFYWAVQDFIFAKFDGLGSHVKEKYYRSLLGHRFQEANKDSLVKENPILLAEAIAQY